MPKSGPPRTEHAVRRRLKRRMRLALRSLTRAGVVATLALLALTLAFFFYPWSLERVDRLIESRASRLSGIDVRIGHAVFHVAQGRVDLVRPRLLDPDSATTQPLLLQLDRVVVTAPIKQILTRSHPVIIDEIAVEGAVDLNLTLKGRRIRPDDRLTRAVEIVRGHFAARGSDAPLGVKVSPPVRIERLTIDPVSVKFEEIVDGERREILNIVNGYADLEPGEELAPRRFYVEGRSAHDPDVEIQLAAGPDWAARQARFNLFLSRFDSDHILEGELPLLIEASPVDIQGRIDWSDPENLFWRGHCLTGAFTLSGLPWRPAPQRLGRASLDWDLNFDLGERRVNLESARLQSEWGSLDVSGWIGMGGARDYGLKIDPLKLESQGIGLLISNLERDGAEHGQGRASAAVTGRIEGSLAEAVPRVFDARIKLSGVDLALEAMPVGVDNLVCDAVLSTSTLTVRQASATVAGLPIAIAGRLEGDPAGRRVNSVDLSWITRGKVEGLNPLMQIGEDPALGGYSVAGRIDGSGRWGLNHPVEGGWINALEQAAFKGKLSLEDARVNAPGLPEPVVIRSGRCVFDPARARVDNLVVNFMGADLVTSVTLEGEKRFWQDPHVKGDAGVRFDLARLGEWYALAGAGQPDGLDETQGRIHCKMTGVFDWPDWSDADFTSTLALDDFATSVAQPAVRGRLNIPHAIASFKPESFVLSPAKGRIDGLDFELESRGTPEAISIEAMIDGPLAAYQRNFPRGLDLFFVNEASTGARASLTLDLNPHRARFSNWLKFFETAMTGDAPLDPDHQWILDWGGMINMVRGEMTWATMPSRLHDITARLVATPERLWSPEPGSVKVGRHSEDLKGTIELRYPKDGVPGFIFNIEGGAIGLEEWIRPWDPPHGHKLEKMHENWVRNRPQYVPEFDPVFILDGAFKTERVTLQRVEDGRNFTGRIELLVSPGGSGVSDLFFWRDLEFDSWGGHCKMSGQLHSEAIAPHFEVENVDLKPFLRSMLKREGIFGVDEGRLTGYVDLNWDRNTEPWTLTGGGGIRVDDIHFVSNPLLRGLGSVTRLPGFEDVLFTSIEGEYRIENGKIMIDRLQFGHPIMDLMVTGWVGFDDTLDLRFQLKWLQIVDKVPLVGWTVEMLNDLSGSVFSFDVRGTMDNPEFHPL